MVRLAIYLVVADAVIHGDKFCAIVSIWGIGGARI